MISELINYIAEQINTTGATGYASQIPTEDNDAAAIRLLGGDVTNSLNCGELYQTPTLDVLYRGTEDKQFTMDKAEEIRKLLNNTYDITLPNSKIISINTGVLQFAFTDDNQRDNYSFILNVNFNN